MEPTNEVEPHSELPPVHNTGEHVHTDMNSEYGPAPLEIAGNVGTKVPKKKSTTGPVINNLDDPSQQTGLPTLASPQTTVMVDDTMIADDTDLIEKEWVDKAKAIIAHTNNDPHLQNKEMTKVKAQYLKKRYDKDLKLEEE